MDTYGANRTFTLNLELTSKLIKILFAITNVNEKTIKKYLFSFGSIVQKGKFSAAAELFVNTLKNVDFPTFGTPTMPTFKFVPTRPIKGFRSGSGAFFGGILKKKKKIQLARIFVCSISLFNTLLLP